MNSISGTLDARDAISGSLGTVYATISGVRYKLMQVIKVEAKFKKTKKDVPILGRTGKGHKSTGWSGEGTCTLHYNTSVFREAARRYKETGEETYYEMQITNEDPSSSVGRQTVVLKDCSFDEILLATLDADADYLKEDISFTFEDFEIPEKFANVTGMLS